ncbi:NnrS family protein [Bradyrhizobium sp. B097]|uniref:NnrS family protein n=1 Tax=Bradyrhizobium sp. B097 TaxID=3140244 RepID=UPI003183AE77
MDLLAPSAGIHAWTGGAIGSMTIAVMTRASLGHSGQALSASTATRAVYASIVIAALARICAAVDPTYSIPRLAIAGIAWTGAFLGFALAYAPLLCSTRKL